MNYAIVENGTVINVALSDEPIASNWIQSDIAKIGDIYDPATGGFTTPSFEELPEPVPQKLSRAQARGALILAGLIDHVQPALDAISDPLQRALAQNDWDNRQDFERDHPQLLAIAAALGLTDEQLDQLFIEGAKL